MFARAALFTAGLSAIALVSRFDQATAADSSTKALPRYRVGIGQQLDYAQTDESRVNGVVKYGDAKDWTVWVARRNHDDSWRIIVRRSETNWWIDEKGNKNQRPGSVVSLGSFEVFPDGRLVSHQTLGSDLDLDATILFPRLPDDLQEMGNHWRDEPNEIGRTYDLAAVVTPTAGDTWTFTAVRSSPMDTGWGQTYKYRFSFDTTRGLIQRATIEGDRQFGAHVSEASTLELRTLKDLDDRKWLELLSSEMDVYAAACKEYDGLTDRMMVETKDAQKLLDDAEGALKHARAKSTLPMVQTAIDDKIKFHPEFGKYLLEESKKIADVIGKPAPAWEAKDLDGKTHSLTDYRGKVVVMDFCHRGCGWCLVSMPHLKKVVDDFNSKQVVVLGMSNDSMADDARFVAEKMQLNYPMLLDDGLSKQYGVTGYPTLFVIDQSGIIRDVEIGFDPKLRDSVTQAVRKLLSGDAKQAN